MSEPTAPLEAASLALVVEIGRMTRLARRLEDRTEHLDSQVLALIEEHGALPMGELARLGRRSTAEIGTSIAELSERGLVRRAARGAVELTPAGESAVRDSFEAWAQVTAERLRAHGGFAPSDVQRELLGALVDAEESG